MRLITINEKLHTIAIEKIAKESGFTKRAARKITPMDYVSSFVNAFFQGDICQANWARTLSLQKEQTVSAHAMRLEKIGSLYSLLLKQQTILTSRYAAVPAWPTLAAVRSLLKMDV